MKFEITEKLEGTILDIGGGGEGVIGRCFPRQTVAVDLLREELADTPDGPVKLVADACALPFLDGCFDNVTLFFSLMYLTREERVRAASEFFRVLRRGGRLYIWDAVVPEDGPEIFIAGVDVTIAGERLHADYGVGCRGREQDAASAAGLFMAAGFRSVFREECGGGFFLCFCKE